MTIGNIVTSIYRRTQTNATSFPAADMLIDMNAAYERVNSLIRKWVDNYHPTAFTSGDVSTGTLVPAFDSLFHDLIPLYVSYDRAVERNLPSVNGFLADIQRKEKELEEWYGMRNYSVFTVTIATPGVATKQCHRLQTNDQVTLITTGALPTGLSADTYYFVIYADDNTFKLSLTRDGTAITTSGSQSGTHYFAVDKARNMRAAVEDNR